MKTNRLKQMLLATILSVLLIPAQGADFKKGNDLVITKSVHDNLYIASGTISVNGTIYGDLTGAAGKITINDSVYGDLFLAGSDIVSNGVINDDGKLMGENITVLKNVNGDLIVMGGFIEISKHVTIDRDLIVLGGIIVVNGTVNGNVIVKGGNATLNGNIAGKVDVQCDRLVIRGSISGPSKLAASEIEFGDDARFGSDVRYWTEDGEIDFSPYMTSGTATYDASLEFEGGNWDWDDFGVGFAGFWLIFTLSVFLVILLLQLIFKNQFHRAAEAAQTGYLRNFGMGVLYFVGLPLVAAIFFITVIGIPVGIFLITLYGLSMMFAFSITSVLTANWINIKYNRTWGNWMIILIAALVSLGLKLVFILPPLGILVNLVFIAIAFGTIIGQLMPKTKG